MFSSEAIFIPIIFFYLLLVHTPLGVADDQSDGVSTHDFTSTESLADETGDIDAEHLLHLDECSRTQSCDEFFSCCVDACDGMMDYDRVRCYVTVGTRPSWMPDDLHRCICLEGFDKPLDLTSFRRSALDRHNTLRIRHGAGNLTLDEDLNESAQKWAENIVALDQFIHNNYRVTENLAQTLPWEKDGFEGVQAWYDEIKDYNYDRPDASTGVIGGLSRGIPQRVDIWLEGHFQTVVWRSQQKLGIGVAKGQNKNWWVVGQYKAWDCDQQDHQCFVDRFDVKKNVVPPI